MSKINVIDSIMGSGKTSWAIQYMKEHGDQKFMYVTPFEDECARIVAACPELNFQQPAIREAFDQRKNKVTANKSNGLRELLERGDNIATTHQLFKHLDAALLDLIQGHGYILIMDEVIEVIRPVEQKESDSEYSDLDADSYREWVQALLDLGIVVKAEGSTGAVKLLPGIKHPLAPKHVLKYAIDGRLVLVNGAMLVWLFPSNCFESFKAVWNLTYLFDGQAQKAFFDIHGLAYETLSVTKAEGRYTLVPWNPELDAERIEAARKLIRIYSGPYNAIGKKTGKSNPLSKTWFEKNKAAGRKLMVAAGNWLRYSASAKGDESIWTTWKSVFDTEAKKPGPHPGGFKKAWVAFNTRATNAYRTRRAVAYLVNVFRPVPVSKYLQETKTPLDEGLYALSEMVQFIWRSRIREGKPIDLFIPSARMRGFLTAWLNGNHSVEVLTEPFLEEPEE